jgi:hypothetical protein
MGCDIHLHIEVKIHGRWEHYSLPNVPRHYRLFTKLAGVREQPGIQPISSPRGLPEDVTYLTKYDAKQLGDDGHSHSWIDAKEIAQLVDSQKDWRYPGDDVEIGCNDLFGWLFGGTVGGFDEYPDDRPEGLEDVRFVFWFDN